MARDGAKHQQLLIDPPNALSKFCVTIKVVGDTAETVYLCVGHFKSAIRQDDGAEDHRISIGQRASSVQRVSMRQNWMIGWDLIGRAERLSNSTRENRGGKHYCDCECHDMTTNCGPSVYFDGN